MPIAPDSSAPFGQRILAAVMFTDVVNFSALAGDKEDRTLNAVHRDLGLISDRVRRFDGKVLKTLGDGLLAYFPSAVNAVSCGQEIQLSIEEQSRANPDRLNLLHRIGIHLGDVLLADNDIFGNGVNIAGRLQSRADPGGLCISQTVFDVVKNRLTLQVNYLGPQELNHIRESIPVYLVTPRKEEVQNDPTLSPTVPIPSRIPVGISFTTSAQVPRSRQTAASTGLTVLVLADLSGRSSRRVSQPVADRRAVHVDIDCFEERFASMAPKLSLPRFKKSGEECEIAFRTSDDFHPDELLKLAAPLRELCTLHRQLQSPGSVAGGVEACQRILGLAPTGPKENGATLVRKLIGGAAPTVESAARPHDAVQKLIQKALAASSASSIDPTPYIKTVEEEMSAHLRAMLHHPDFQQLEAGWACLRLLVTEAGGDSDIRIKVLDISKAEMSADAAGLAGVLQQSSADIILADFAMGPSASDIRLLAELGAVAAANHAQLFAGADPGLVGCASFAHEPDPDNWTVALPGDVALSWDALRQSPIARNIILAAPRFLLRQPYGQWGDPIQSFVFEEVDLAPAHEALLWGNSAYVCAFVAATEFQRTGVARSSTLAGKLRGRPVVRFHAGAEKSVVPAGEAWLTDRAVQVMRQRGVTAVVSHRTEDSVTIGTSITLAHQSIAASAARLTQ